MPRATVAPDELIDMSDRIIAMQLALRGDFSDEIKALKAERAGLADDLKALGTRDDVAKMRADAEAYASATKGKADDLMARAQDLADQAKAASAEAQKNLEAATARAAAASQAEADISGRSAALDERERKIISKQDSRDAGLTARAEAIDKQQLALIDAQEQLKKDRDEFNQRLAALAFKPA